MNITVNSTFAHAEELPVSLPLEVKIFLVTTFGTVWTELSCTIRRSTRKLIENFLFSDGELVCTHLMDIELEIIWLNQLSLHLT